MPGTLVAQVLDTLRGIVGEPHARPARAGDAIDGVAPSCVVEPGSVEEVAATLRLAAFAGLAVVPRGGATKLGWGAPPSRADVVLRTTRLDRILEHAAGDLVVRAQAGVRLETLQHQLAAAGQWLALDPPEPGGSLGGVVAAAASGPRRHRYGTARDLLIGVTVALADGSVAKAGGKVVKNVAGYDLCKLFTGSFGTLGVIVETTFRLHPRPAGRSLVIVEVETPRVVGEAVRSLLHAPLVPSAVELAWTGHSSGGGRLAVLFEGVPAGASAQAEQAAALLAGHGRARVVPEASFDREWSSVALCLDQGDGGGSEQRGAGISLELSDVVGRVPELIEAVRAVARERSLPVRIGGRAGLGVLGATFAGDDAAGQIAAVTELRLCLSPETSVAIRQAPPGVKRAIDVWGDPGDALALMRRVKGRFDPQGTLSPGRFVGGL